MINKWFRLIFFICFLSFTACDKNELVDPFWKINLSWNKEILTNKLLEYTKNGEILNCVFSFEKEIYIKSGQFDAKISGSLGNPVFEKKNLQSFNYSLIVKFKNEPSPQFNKEFYEYFKKKMKANYGDFSEESVENNKIHLNWNIENKKTIKTTVIKNINLYIVDIKINV